MKFKRTRNVLCLRSTFPYHGRSKRRRHEHEDALADEPRTQERHHVLGIRIAPEHLLLEDEVAVDVDVEHAADSRHEVDAGDVLLEFLENLRRQTDGVGERASGDAVLDADPRPVAHSSALTCSASQSRIRFHESIR